MPNFHYALPSENYSWKNALLWGNFLGHCKKASEGNFRHRSIHVLIAAAEFLPVIGQIASISEKVIVNNFGNFKNDTSSPILSKRQVSHISIDNNPRKSDSSTGLVSQKQNLHQSPSKDNVNGKNLTTPPKQPPSSTSSSTAINASSVALNKSEEIGNSALTPPNELNENLQKERLAAAIKIQSVFRGHLARLAVKKEKRHLLGHSLFERAKPLIDEPEKLKDLPTAAKGRTRVYLPDDLPIVLKQSGSPENKARFDKMRQAREICDESNYPHLVIPTARVHGSFIIESRLPIIKDYDMKVHIGFYLDHVEQLTEAVAEFTGFLCQARLYDITGGTNDAYSTLSTVPIGRYDNIAMYLEKGIGKLGLIDLEGFNPNKQEGFFACREAVRLFPHHLDAIIHAAKKFDPNIENHRKALEKERDGILKYFEKAYQNHLDFVKQKNIDFTNPTKFDDISQSRKETIRKAVETVIQEENNDFWFKDCLGEAPDVTMKLFNEIAFPEILDATSKFIADLLKKHLQYQGGSTTISSYSTLLAVRTLKFNYDSKLYKDLKKMIASKLDMLTFKSELKKSEFASEIIDTILQELEKGKEIAYYNPSFGVGGYAVHCIFC